MGKGNHSENKKSWIGRVVLVLLLAIVVTGASWVYVKEKKKDNKDSKNVVAQATGEEEKTEPEVVEEVEEPKEKTLDEQVDDEIAAMTLDEKIGQLFIICDRTTGYTDNLDNTLKTIKPAGFILFDSNITNYENTKNYIQTIKDTATTPMFIAVDQEGGLVQRVKNVPGVNVLKVPNMYAVGQKGDQILAEDVGKVVASEIAAFGFNLDFAPVADIFSNPNNTVIGKRAFGNNAERVIEMILPFAKGMRSEGVIPCFKHFPGHGDTSSDSHVELPIVYNTKEQLLERELVTFKAAIDDGAELIMTAHIALPNITGDYKPASLSKEIIGDILRGELNYNGVVITDAVEMNAISNNYTIKEVCNLALNAGVDIILMPKDPMAAVNSVKELLDEGSLTEERINESVKRILLLKHNSGLYEPKEPTSEYIGSEGHQIIINSIY